jgi:EpsI family protein
MKNRRLALCVILVVATGAFRHLLASPGELTIDLSRLPTTIGGWRGEPAAPLDESVVRLLAADSYINRTYSAAGLAPVDLYVAFYAGQKPGDSIHSPLNCLPGTGWEPVAISTMAMPRPDGTIGSARRMVVRKDDQQDLVLYWYQVHGRMLANEWNSKLYLLLDGVRLHRTDAALVRIVVPIGASVDQAEQEAVAFGRALLPGLDSLWQAS